MVPVKRYSLCRVELTALHKQITSDNNEENKYNVNKNETTTKPKTQAWKQIKMNYMFVAKTCVGRDETFVATNICRNIILPRQKFSHALLCFVARKLYLTRQYLSWQKFC